VPPRSSCPLRSAILAAMKNIIANSLTGSVLV
jgi:hypothetical protein